MSFEYPVFLDLTGVEVLVVGGGPVGLRKATGLAEAGARVTVVSPDLVDGFAGVVDRIERRPYRSGEAAQYQLVMTATSDPVVNAEAAADAKAAKVWINSADDPGNCTFILPAVARRGLISVAVSTRGASPSLAGRLRDIIAEHVLTDRAEQAAEELARQRAAIHGSGASTETIDWTDRVDEALDAEP